MSFRARFTRSPYARTRTNARAALNRPWFKTDPALLDPHPGHPASKSALVVVIDTKAVAGPGGVGFHHWEIVCGPDLDAPRLVLYTRDESVYNAAAIVEGHDRRVRVTYHPETRGIACDVLDRVEEVAP